MNRRHGDTIGDKSWRIRQRLHGLSPSRQCRQLEKGTHGEICVRLPPGTIAPGLSASRVKCFSALATRRHRRQLRNHSVSTGDKIGRIGDNPLESATTVQA